LEVVGGAFPVRRELLVWVPPGYDEPANSQKTYPVLYLQDGQNIFSKSGIAPAEWGVDETALELIESGKVPAFIVVGIPSLDAHRMSEYIPFEGFDRAYPKGDVYGRWLVTQVMPRVERAFRVRTDRESTFVGGSSLGAVISLAIGTEYADRIGGLLLESPSFLGEKSLLLDYVQSRPLTSARVYIGMGGQEFAQKAPSDSANLSMVKGAKSLQAIFASRPTGTSSVMMTVVETHTHNEIAWAERLPKALEFLMGSNR
jgi:enterochelin esterase-like enzyme